MLIIDSENLAVTPFFKEPVPLFCVYFMLLILIIMRIFCYVYIMSASVFFNVSKFDKVQEIKKFQRRVDVISPLKAAVILVTTKPQSNRE